MGKITATVAIEDEPAPDLLLSQEEMEIEQDHRLAATFRLKLPIGRRDDGLWRLLDDERLKLWKKVKISAAVGDEEQDLIEGFLTQIKTHFDPDENSSYLELIGMDATCLMGLEENIKDWPNYSDSAIAREIFSDYGLTPEIEDVDIIHDEAISTMIQRDTDIQFLKRLARRNGFECRVNGNTGVFRKPSLSEKPQPTLAAHFGPETNLSSFEVTANVLSPLRVEMHQIDTIAKEMRTAKAELGERSLGKNAALSIKPPGSPKKVQSRMFVRHAVATGQPEMENLCKALFDEAEWFIEASGEINTSVYGSILQVAQLVPIKGVGELFSGLYYVTNVRHRFTSSGDGQHYAQHFKARRNAFTPNGDEFGDNGSLF